MPRKCPGCEKQLKQPDKEELVFETGGVVRYDLVAFTSEVIAGGSRILKCSNEDCSVLRVEK